MASGMIISSGVVGIVPDTWNSIVIASPNGVVNSSNVLIGTGTPR